MTVDKPESDLFLVAFKPWKTEKFNHMLPTGLMSLLFIWSLFGLLFISQWWRSVWAELDTASPLSEDLRSTVNTVVVGKSGGAQTCVAPQKGAGLGQLKSHCTWKEYGVKG